LDRIDQLFIIALDDYHRIKETAVHELLAAMLEHPSLTMHLIIIGRVDPPMPISRLRARSQVTELRTQDLRFTPVETKIFLEQLLETQVDSSTAAAVEAKTEGWVTGLRLAVISMRHQGKLDPRLLEPQVDAQYVMEYLFSEVFSGQPPEISQHLMASAILDRFCGPLCEAICVSNTEPFTFQGSGWEFIN
jgi:LuxR family maltose regulon positive regulatory protein